MAEALARIRPLVPATKLWPQNSIPSPPAGLSRPILLQTATKHPLATACERWMTSHAPCCSAPSFLFSAGCQPMAVG